MFPSHNCGSTLCSTTGLDLGSVNPEYKLIQKKKKKGSGHEASARHLTITKRSRSGRKSQDSDSTDMLLLHRPSQATLTCRLVFSVGAFVIPFFPSHIDVPQMVQGMIGPSLSSPLSIHHPSQARATSCIILVSCLGGGVRFVKT